MPAPLGSKNALGNKGGGRKSAYQEKADAEVLHEMFFGLVKGRSIKKKIKTGNYSLKDKFVEQCYEGNQKILIEIFKKIFPEKYEHEFKKPVNITVTRGGDSPKGPGPIQGTDNPVAQTDNQGVGQ
ncbi:MAG: hypothetical protein KAU20_07505 [Nanoarchaeota archaeon]|nr:hypothetical protein [Nanoarchaeota archaeon]